MTVTAYVTRDIGRTFGVTHGPITRSDPIRSDPALLQLHRWSPSHHGVQLVTRASAPIVAPSPVTTPDAMMSLTAIAHLDFEPEVPCEHSLHRARHADESAAFLVQVIGFCHLGGGERYALCRSGYALSWRVGVLCPVCRSPFTEPGQEPPLRIVQVLR